MSFTQRRLLQTEVTINNDIEKRIVEAFEVFDYTGNQVIDVQEVSTVLYSLGCVPTKHEIEEIVENVRDTEFPEKVHLSKFVPVISELISKYRFHPASAEELLNAFRVLDEKNAKCLNKADFTDKLTSKGEPLNAEELNEMMTIATNPETDDTILYEYYINYLMVD